MHLIKTLIFNGTKKKKGLDRQTYGQTESKVIMVLFFLVSVLFFL